MKKKKQSNTIKTPFYKNKDLLTKLTLSILSGFLVFIGFPKTSVFIAPFFSLIPLIYIIENEVSYKKIFLYGYITQIVAMIGGFYWLIDTIKLHGHLPFAAAFPIFILYISFFGLRFPIFMIFSKFLKNKLKLSSYLIYPFTYTAIEFIFPDLFPWFLANTQSNNLFFIQIADITGVYGITFILALTNTTVYELVKIFIKKKSFKENVSYKWISITVGLIAVLYIYGAIRMNYIETLRRKAKPIRIGTIQPNTPLLKKDRRFSKKRIRNKIFRMSKNLLKNKAIDIFIWPESAAQIIYKSPRYKIKYREPIEKMVKKYGVYFMFSDIEIIYQGITKNGRIREVNPFQKSPPPFRLFRGLKKIKRKHYSTSVMLNDKAKIIGTYRKNYPLPFGEYMPLGNTFPSLRKLFAEIGNFSASDEIVVFKTKFGIVAPSICYELIIPSFTRKFIKKGANIILNQTNDGWFGKTKASYEHLAIALFRSIENRVPIVRSTNSGVSTFISPSGRFTTKLTKVYVTDTLTGEVRPVNVKTFYTIVGNLFGYLIFIYFLTLFILAYYKKIKEDRRIFFIKF